MNHPTVLARPRFGRVAVVSSLLVTIVLAGCDDDAATASQQAAASASAAAAAAQAELAATAEVKPVPPSEPVKASRPSTIDTELTAARRDAIEKKYPEAKGFLVAKDIEEVLKKDKAIKEKEAAVSAFDGKAKGRWMLFAERAVNLTDSGFDLALVYTPQMPNDPMGMSRQFFELTFSDIEGYKADELKSGNVVVVLAKYQGKAKVGPGHELVAAGVWGE